jgi:DNA helicase IV
MPNSREISDEQEEIYMDAPMDGVVMVAGPPGTGKTVIAFLRALALSKRNKPVSVMMYSKVLKKYASNAVGQQGEKIVTTTLLSWAHKWWEKHQISSQTNIGDKIYLECPFKDKDKAKANGAKWDGKNKKWWIGQSEYNANQALFKQWIKENHEAPKLDEFLPDWQLMMEKLAMHAVNNGTVNNFGYIIIDEAQDFPPAMFRLLRFALTRLEKAGITILADENQRLFENNNATIAEINQALAIPKERQYLLTENFRNTKDIATLAAHFYVGLSTGMPKPPNKKGEKPNLVKTTSLDDQVQFIFDAVTNRAYGEVGIFSQNDTIRNKLFNKLQHRLKGKYRVQSYSSTKKYKDAHPIEDLIFDTKGTVTIINRQSCKGLEFDAVFIPDIQAIPIDGSNIDTFKMNMYVMCSRARQALYLLYATASGDEPDILSYFPDKESELLEYIYE